MNQTRLSPKPMCETFRTLSKQKHDLSAYVVGLRPERGYLGTKPDTSAVKSEKTLRCQFGQIYDAKKVGNNYVNSAVNSEADEFSP